MRLAFLWWWGRAEEIYPYWRDGLRAAIEEIGKNNDVDIYLGETIPEKDYDCYLMWGDSNCPAISAKDFLTSLITVNKLAVGATCIPVYTACLPLKLTAES